MTQPRRRCGPLVHHPYDPRGPAAPHPTLSPPTSCGGRGGDTPDVAADPDRAILAAMRDPLDPSRRLPLSALPPRDWAAAGAALDRDGAILLEGALTPPAFAKVEAAVE